MNSSDKARSIASDSGRLSRSTALAVLLIIFTVSLAHYFNFQGMGLYEDDYGGITARFLNEPLTLEKAADRVKYCLTKWPFGRPGRFAPEFLAAAGYKLGGRHGMRLIAFLIVTGNSLMAFFILRKVAWHNFAVCGAIAFALFPAVTVHSYITNVLLAQLALLMALVSFYLYLCGRRISSYLVIIAALSLYESVAFLLFAAPLCLGDFNWKKGREFLYNAGVISALIAANFAFKILLKDVRLTGTDPFYLKGSYFSYIPKIIKSLFIGPAVSISTYVTRISYAVENWSSQLSMVLLFSASVFFIYFFANHRASPESGEQGEYREKIFRLLLLGVFLSALGYVVTSFVYYPPDFIRGRASRVHIAGMLGVSMLFTSILMSVHHFLGRLKLKRTALFFLVAYFSLLMCFRYLVQLDYVKAWDNQKKLWVQVNELCPDLEEDTVVFVSRRSMPNTTFILSYSWSIPLVQRFIYKYPEAWLKENTFPRVFIVRDNWAEKVRLKDGKPQWLVPAASWRPHWEDLPESNLILLRKQTRDGKLKRISGTIDLQGVSFNFRPLPEPTFKNTRKRGSYYELFF